MGFKEEALKASRGAVELRKELAKQDPSVYNIDLALSLHNLSIDLSEMGLIQEAQETVKEAIEIQKEVISGHPHDDSFQNDLTKFEEFLAELSKPKANVE